MKSEPTIEAQKCATILRQMPLWTHREMAKIIDRETKLAELQASHAELLKQLKVLHIRDMDDLTIQPECPYCQAIARAEKLII